MQIHIETRGRTADYAFLGAPPSERWWLDFRDFTSFEQPTILVVSDGARWRSYVSGIPSARRDRVGTTIYYAVVASGLVSDSINGVIGLVRAWLDDLGTGAERGTVHRALDGAFGEDDVERLILDRSEQAVTTVRTRIESVLARFAGMGSVRPPVVDFESWMGAIESPRSRDGLVARVAEHLQGQAGAATMLNLVGELSQAEALVERHGRVAIVIDVPIPRLGPEPVAIQKKKPSASRTFSSKPRSHQHTVILVVLAIAVVTCLAWLLRSPPR